VNKPLLTDVHRVTRGRVEDGGKAVRALSSTARARSTRDHLHHHNTLPRRRRRRSTSRKLWHRGPAASSARGVTN